jgi:Tannase and feruloyl esterase
VLVTTRRHKPQITMFLSRLSLCTNIGGVSLVLACSLCVSPARAEISPKMSCAELSHASSSVTLNPGTQIISSVQVAAADGMPSYCSVDGQIKPQVGFRLLLPTRGWNGRFIEFGCGGHCGVMQSDQCMRPLRRGYACIVSDLGHRGSGTGVGGIWAKTVDGTWAKNNLPAKLDLAYRGAHVTALAGKATASRFYGARPAHSYFMGCSNGGREALQEAQHFPMDFDGIVAGSPPIRFAEVYMMYAWAYQTVHGPDGRQILGSSQLKLLHDAALASCDANDGLRDGIIGDPLACRFAPATLLCRKGQTGNCLDQRQVGAAEKIYAGPITSGGKRLFASGPLPGSEYDAESSQPSQWAIFVGNSDGTPSAGIATAEQGFKYILFDENPPQSWRLTDFNFDSDPTHLDEVGVLYDSRNPDLSAFKENGGKLLIYGGMNDPVVLPRTITDYYRKITRVMGGGPKTHDFARLYMQPGVGHCGSGSGAGSIDYLTAIENWVERGAAPDKLIAFHFTQPGDDLYGLFPPVAGDIQFSRPLFPYPLQARYRSGDPNQEGSFTSYDPERVH